MLHKLIVACPIDGTLRPVGHVFDLPEGTMPPGSHAQGAAGMLTFRPYSVPLEPEEIEEHEAEQARLKADAEAARAEQEHEEQVRHDRAPLDPPKGQRVRLTAPAFLHGALRDVGYEFFLAEGEKGPHRSVRKGHEKIDVEHDNQRIDADVVDEPLYENVP